MASTDAHAHDGASQAYGGFALSGMHLALPMDALREVVPSEDWIPLPCPNPSVVGGVNLRGVVVPVLD
jgi:purine-binding chemotaxis protein CheW